MAGFNGFSSAGKMDAMDDATSGAGFNNVVVANAFSTATNDKYDLSIYQNETGGIFFYKNGTLLGTHTPGGGDRNYFFYWVSNLGKTAQIDYLNIHNGPSCPLATGPSPPAPAVLSINGSINDSSIFYLDSINVSFNATANYNLSFGQITINDTGVTRTFSFPLNNQTPAQFSQNFTISCAPCVVNITGIINDSNNNFAQNSTLYTINSNIIINATDLYDGEKLNNFSVNFSGGPSGSFNVSTNNGIISIGNISNGVYDLRFSSFANGGYLEYTYPNVNINGQSFTGQLYQVEVLINASQVITGNPILDFAVSVPLQYNQSRYVTSSSYLSEDLLSSSFESQGCPTGDNGLAPAIDGNWNTNTSGGTVYENYTKPQYVVGGSFKFALTSVPGTGELFNTSCWDGSQWTTLFNSTTSVQIGRSGSNFFPVNMTATLPSSCLNQNVIQIKTVARRTGNVCNGGVGSGGFAYYYEGAMNWTTATSSIARLLLKRGSYNITGNTTGYLNVTNQSLFLPYSVNYMTLNFGTNLIRIDAKALLTNNYISSFTVYASNGTFNGVKSTTNGNITFLVLPGNYTLNFSAVGYANLVGAIGFTSSNIFPNYTFSVYTTNSVNFSIYDEILGRSNFFNGTPVTLEIISDSYSVNYTTSNASLYVDLLNPAFYRIGYSATNYPKRYYYFTLTNSSHTDIELYLLSLGNSTNIIITVQDNTGTAIENSTVYLKRYYVDSNSYRTVAMALTNNEGQASLNVDFNNAFYQFLATIGDFFVSTIGSKIFVLTPTLTISTVSSPFVQIDDVNNLGGAISFNNVTSTFSFTYVSKTGTSIPATLQVKKITGLEELTICMSSDTSSSGTLLCQVDMVNQSGVYLAEGLLDIGGETGNILIDTQQIVVGYLIEAKNKFGTQSILMTVFLSGTVGLLGASINPAVGILLFLLSFGVSVYIGFTLISLGLFMVLVIIGAVLIYKMRS